MLAQYSMERYPGILCRAQNYPRCLGDRNLQAISTLSIRNTKFSLWAWRRFYPTDVIGINPPPLTASPANAFAFEFYAQFMDGGVSHFSGNYFIGLKGSWVHGMKAVRFLCSALGLPQPARRHFETSIPSQDALWAQHLKANLNSETYERFSKLGFFTQPEDREA